MFCIQNLVSQIVEPCVPWEFRATIPEEVKGKGGKSARDKWINDPSTYHQVYSAFEGVAANVRVTKAKGADEGNPPFRLHAFVVDVDAPLTEDEIRTGLARMGETVPNYFERTLSGNARFVFLFERPIALPSRKFAVEFLEYCLGKLRFDLIGVGFDRAAFVEPNRYYTNSCEWYDIAPEKRVPFAMLQGWFVEVAERHRWAKERGSIEIPLPIVAEELAKRFGDFPACWPSDFALESQGPTFWVPASSSPKSAIVKTTGMFTFSANASKPFYTWSDLLGAEFVEKYKAERLGKAVEGIYHDGTKYYRQDGYGDWKWYSKEDIASHLNVSRGLSTMKDAGLPSEVARAIEHVQNWQGVVGAAPFVFQKPGVIIKNGNRFLNTHTRLALAPAGGRAIWGPAGNMPFLSAYFDGIFDPTEQKEFFLSWLSRFYRGAHMLELESGQNIFMLGSPGVGKTLLSQGIIPRLVGGSSDAEDYLLGKTQFNSDLFETAFWTVDDNSATVNADSHRKFSAMIKKMAANTTFSYHAKFRVPCSVDWLGRVFITANDDEESARIVPDLSISILDKLGLFRTARVAPVEYPRRVELLKTLDRELPVFARFLLDYDIPEHCVGSARYGVKAYHEPSLLRTAEQSSRTASFAEIIADWADSYFAEHQEKFWEGTAFQFLKALNKDLLASQAGLRSLTPLMVATNLATLKAKGTYNIEAYDRGGSRVWKIHRPARAEAILPLAGNGTGTAKFSKNDLS